MIIAFDLSISSTGYSVFSDDGKLKEVGHIETNGDDSTPLRLREISRTMKRLKKKYKPSLILIERGFYRFAGSTEQIFRVNGITNLLFWDVKQIEIHATSIRKILTGHGNIKKDEMEVWIREHYPSVAFANNDEVDSYALGIAHLKQTGVL